MSSGISRRFINNIYIQDSGMFAAVDLAQIGLWVLYISLPILILFFIYTLLTKAFEYVGFTSLEATIIVLLSVLFFIDIKVLGLNISNIHLFTYGLWNVGVNMGGAIIPIVISIYLSFKKKIDWKKSIISIAIVAIITYLITSPDPNKGIVAKIPWAFIPAIAASVISIIFYYKNFKKAAPLAYISGTIGVLVGADFFHVGELLSNPITSSKVAIIGGAGVFDMIFITGILAVILDGLIMFRQRLNAGVN